MADEPGASDRFSLSRWSRRKLEATRAEVSPVEVTPVPEAVPAVAQPGAATAESQAPPPATRLPPVDTLTFDSDFAAFLKPEVDPGTQRAALKKLFSDPRFNVMDGLDTYIDDYTRADPMPAGMLAKLANVYAKLTGDEKDDAAPLTRPPERAASIEATAGAPTAREAAVEPVAPGRFSSVVTEPVVPPATTAKLPVE